MTTSGQPAPKACSTTRSSAIVPSTTASRSCAAQVVAAPGRVVVDDDDLVAAGEQALGEMRADEAGPARDQHSHANTSSFSCEQFAKAGCVVVKAHAARARAKAAPRRGGRSGARSRGRRAPCRCRSAARPRAASDERISSTKSRTAPGSRDPLLSGTGKPILSVRSRDRRWHGLARAPARSTCFIVPFLNLMSDGIVAASSTSGGSRNGTRDSSPCAMLTRSSTWSSAGRSVLKSKWVIESKYDSLPTFSPWKICAEALVRRVVAEERPVDLVGQVGRAVDEPEVARVEVVEEPLAPELLQQRLVVPQRGQVRDDRLVGDDEVAGVHRSLDRALDALLEVRDQVAGVAAEDLVAALAAEDHLASLRGEARRPCTAGTSPVRRPGDRGGRRPARCSRRSPWARCRASRARCPRARRGRGRSGSRRRPRRPGTCR